jgi:endogenous inhibitor of DNA gyrase (YacG/DUF329 family)
MLCPICKKPVADDEPDKPTNYPFCSQRCKLIDLGRWLGGKYQIPVSSSDDPTEPHPKEQSGETDRRG